MLLTSNRCPRRDGIQSNILQHHAKRAMLNNFLISVIIIAALLIPVEPFQVSQPRISNCPPHSGHNQGSESIIPNSNPLILPIQPPIVQQATIDSCATMSMFESNTPPYVQTPTSNDPAAVAQTWEQYFHKQRTMKFQIIAAPTMEKMAQNIVDLYPHRFRYYPTLWEKFPDGTDNIEIGGFHPVNFISGENVLLLASFHNNDVTLSQFSVMIALLQSFIHSLTVVLPFYPVGTMERVLQEGKVATANTYAQMFSNLPSCGKPTRLIVYDLHTLQNRFYLHGNAIASLQTTIPILINRLRSTNIRCVAFPDDGAAKRFGGMFFDSGFEIVTCGKTRDGDKRTIIIQDGDCAGKDTIIIDDLVQTGGTLFETGIALKKAGATSVNAFVAHGVFPNDSWKRFLLNGDRNCFAKFFVTNSIPSVAERLPADDIFEVLPLTAKIVEDLDQYS